MVSLHPTARTTPRIRQEIKENRENLTITEQAARYNISRKTVLKWRHRESLMMRPVEPELLKSRLPIFKEHIICELRKSTLLPLDDLWEVVEGLGIAISRSALDRALGRNGLSNLKEYLRSLNQRDEPHSSKGIVKECDVGYLHIDIKYLPKVAGERQYLIAPPVWSLPASFPIKAPKALKAFLFFPFFITKVLTDNGKEFTDAFAKGRTKPSGNHPFDRACALHDIVHRRTRPYTPKTNGMTERVNGKIQESVLERIHFSSQEEPCKSILAYVALYNGVIKHSGLGQQTPVSFLAKRYKEEPKLFKRDFVMIG